MRFAFTSAVVVATCMINFGPAAHAQIPSYYPDFGPRAQQSSLGTPVPHYPTNYGAPQYGGQPFGFQDFGAREEPQVTRINPYQELTPPIGGDVDPASPRNLHSQNVEPSPESIVPGRQFPDQSMWNEDAYGGFQPHEVESFGGHYGHALYGQYCNSCGANPCSCRRRGGWFGGLGGVIMERDYESNVYLSYYNGDPRNSILVSRSVEVGSLGGYQASIGRSLCNGWRWMATYWGLPEDDNMVAVTGMPDTRLYGMQMINYTPAGFGVDNVFNWYNSSVGHRLQRSNEFHNVEISLLRGGCCSSTSNACQPCGDAWTTQWQLGARFFRFDEFFQYASSVPGGYVNNPRELYYNINTENNLIGLQLGGSVERGFCGCLTAYAGTKFGVYNNYIEYDQAIIGPSGYAVINQGSYNGFNYMSVSSKNDLAVLGEFDAGVHYQFAKCWRATLGYRAMAATGIALAPDQIPYNFSYLPEINYIDSDGSLILHGAYVGIEFKR